MLVLSMNSKRQRRPNVRLGEIGDVSAAFACGFLQRMRENLGQKRWKHAFLNPNEIDPSSVFEFSKQKSPEFTVMDPGVSPRIAADFHHNRENKNLNSSKLAFEHVNLDKIDITKSAVNFGTVTRKSRVMRSRNTGGKNNAFGGAWNSKLSPEFSSEGGKDDGEKGYVGFTSNICDGYYPENGIKDVSGHEAPATSKEACEFDKNETTYDAWKLGNSTYFQKEDTFYEGNDAFIKNGVEWNEMRYGGSDVCTIQRWLKELGFGKYAGVFEMHEVDEESLPLLTLEDLKEMGVFAVGPRRKLYNAIQQLRGEVASN